VPPDRIDKLRRFRVALDDVAGPGATYWDLTNRQSYYGLVHRPVPVRYAAHASAVNSLQQAIMLKQLKASPPGCIWLDPMMVVDNKANFRSYYLYRFALLNYRVVRQDGFTFLVNEQVPGYQYSLSDKEAVDWLSQLFDLPDLGALPTGWGASWNQLQAKAHVVRTLEPIRADTGGDALRQVWTLQWGNESFAGKDADLLVIELTASNHDEPVQLSWENELGAQSTLQFDGREGIHVVPLGAYPRWLLAQSMKRVQMVTPSGVVVKSVALWQRAEVELD
jgi:hypothetical protein